MYLTHTPYPAMSLFGSLGRSSDVTKDYSKKKKAHKVFQKYLVYFGGVLHVHDIGVYFLLLVGTYHNRVLSRLLSGCVSNALLGVETHVVSLSLLLVVVACLSLDISIRVSDARIRVARVRVLHLCSEPRRMTFDTSPHSPSCHFHSLLTSLPPHHWIPKDRLCSRDV